MSETLLSARIREIGSHGDSTLSLAPTLFPSLLLYAIYPHIYIITYYLSDFNSCVSRLFCTVFWQDFFFI